jgi:hypothetical protein
VRFAHLWTAGRPTGRRFATARALVSWRGYESPGRAYIARPGSFPATPTVGVAQKLCGSMKISGAGPDWGSVKYAYASLGEAVARATHAPLRMAASSAG